MEMSMRYNAEIFESPYFVPEPNNWHLKPDAPEDLKKKFEEFIANYEKAHSEEKPQSGKNRN
jgi:hypothetical protein